MQLAINAENYILLAALFFSRFSMCGPSLIEEKTKKNCTLYQQSSQRIYTLT